MYSMEAFVKKQIAEIISFCENSITNNILALRGQKVKESSVKILINNFHVPNTPLCCGA
jgi:hypothetical protein